MSFPASARAVVLALLLGGALGAAAEVAVPALTARVTDLTATLSREQRAELEQILEAFERRKGSQVAVLIVPSTAPETIEQYSLRVVEQWKLGRRKIDDGALLIVAKDDRTLRIEVGYGLEGALNDATSKRIISEVIVPLLKTGDFAGGIKAGIAQIMRVIDGEPLPGPPTRPQPRGNASGLQQILPVLFVLALVGGGVLRSVFGRVPGALFTGGAIAFIAWLLIGTLVFALLAGVVAMLFTLMGGGMGGPGLGGFYGGARRGGFGGGGGGFSGGGGGFGGGGASGRW